MADMNMAESPVRFVFKLTGTVTCSLVYTYSAVLKHHFLFFLSPLWVDCFTFSVHWTVIKEMLMETQNMMHAFILYLLTSFIAILCHCLKFFGVGRQDRWTAKVQSLFPELRVNVKSSQIGFQNQLSIYNYQSLWSLIRYVDVRQCYVCWKFVNSWRWTQCVESLWTLGTGHSVLAAHIL